MTTKKKAAKASKKSVRKNVEASSAAALVSKTKANAEKTAQPGIIASIMTCLTEAKSKKVMVTVDEIVAVLAKQFPDRQVAGMTTTVRAQLSRLPSEKEFDIKKLRDGRIMRYVAA